MNSRLVLSTFTGLGLLDLGFKKAGFVVVSAGDLVTGSDVRDFRSMPNKFSGVIGGSPCQDFSGLKRVKTDYSLEMLGEFKRIVMESEPDWAVLENVKGVPDLFIDGYSHQRIDINQGWYDDYSRLRHIQFYSKEGLYLDIPRLKMRPNLKPLATATDNRPFSELCHIQGLPDGFDLPDFNLAGKKKMVGNGVPLSIANVIAQAVKSVTSQQENNVTDRSIDFVTKPGVNIVTSQGNYCPCGCKRNLYGRRKYYDSACRKRAQRKRDNNLLSVKARIKEG